MGCRSNWQILLLRKCATRAWYPDILRRWLHREDSADPFLLPWRDCFFFLRASAVPGWCLGSVPGCGASARCHSRCWGALRGVHGEVKHPAHLRRTRPQPTLMVEKVGQGEGARTGLRDACASHARTTACPPPTKRMGKMAFRIAFPISQLIIFW